MSRYTPKAHRNANVITSPDEVNPYGDLVLVRRLPEDDIRGRIFLPNGSANPDKGLRRGVVVSAGPGDKLLLVVCVPCGTTRVRVLDAPWGSCEYCGSTEAKVLDQRRAPMHAKVGDEVIYTRVPANEIDIDNVTHTFLHEEQHILAVIEREAA